MKSSYLRNISIIATVFIFLILFLALANLYISIQLRNEFLNYDRGKIVSIARLCTHYLKTYKNQSERSSLFRNLSNAFNVDHLIISDTLGNKIFDSRSILVDFNFSGTKIDYSLFFETLPDADEMVQAGDSFIFRSGTPPFYLYISLSPAYSAIFDNIFKWHIFYITLSLIFVGFLGIFLIRNLFLPMRYVATVARELGVELKKEDFVSETFNEIFKKMKVKEEMLVEFSGYIAHEFRNSLAAIIGLARLVEKGKKSASAIIEECRTMEELIARLLEYSRPVELVVSPVNVRQLIDDAVTRVSLPGRIQIKKKIAKHIPTIHGDYDLLQVVLTNLLKNSIEAIKDKGTIILDVLCDDDLLTIAITDDGCGLDAQELEKVFSPFYSKKESGMGLGLAYVKKIVEIHKGRIEVNSKKGKGTTFTLKLPREH
jgi:signal transduction histidine kinase